MDSSCELLRSIDPARGSVYCCEAPCRTLRSISKHQGSPGGVRLREENPRGDIGRFLCRRCCGLVLRVLTAELYCNERSATRALCRV